jgi:hypothetical protein
MADLEELEYKILTKDISKEASRTKEWGGADVIISSQLNETIQKWLEDHPVVV